MWKEAALAHSEVIFQLLPGWT